MTTADVRDGSGSFLLTKSSFKTTNRGVGDKHLGIMNLDQFVAKTFKPENGYCFRKRIIIQAVIDKHKGIDEVANKG